MENLIKNLSFNDKSLIPVIVQDHLSSEVLMLAYMNQEALDLTLTTGKMHYFSRSRHKLWLKGETSGHYQYLKELSIDCDADTLLAKVEQIEAACHTGNYSCFYREIDQTGNIDDKMMKIERIVSKEISNGLKLEASDNLNALQDLYKVILDRREHPVDGSYTNYLFEKGIDKILKKVGEEAAEVIIAAKNNSKEEITYEVADLFYHLCVLLVDRDVTLEDIFKELENRR